MKPCIRGLREFKKGCPEKLWEENGCPAWKRYDFNNNRIIEDCIDRLQEKWLFEIVRLSEGNQQAIESLRNVVDNVNKENRQRFVELKSDPRLFIKD